MIVEWIVGLAAGIGSWFAGLFPTDWEPPEFLVDLDGTLNGVLANLGGVSVWADWVYIFAVVGAVLLIWGIGLVIKLARAVAAHIPFFGGAG